MDPHWAWIRGTVEDLRVALRACTDLAKYTYLPRVPHPRAHLRVAMLLEEAWDKPVADSVMVEIATQCFQWGSRQGEPSVQLMALRCNAPLSLVSLSGDYAIPVWDFHEQATRRQDACRAAVVALLGACGRWRRAYGGRLRDVSQSLGRRLWRERRNEVWLLR